MIKVWVRPKGKLKLELRSNFFPPFLLKKTIQKACASGGFKELMSSLYSKWISAQISVSTEWFTGGTCSEVSHFKPAVI